MCLDSAFTSTLPPQGVPIANPEPELILHFTYFELLDRLRREDCLDTGSIRQKVFAFQQREDDRFFIPANSLLHAVFISKPDATQEKRGCVVTHEELRRVLDHEIREYTYLRAKQQNNAYRKRLGAAPCLATMKGECMKPDCQLQHIRPDKMTADWFNARIQLVLTEIQILNLAGFHPQGAILCVLHWPKAEAAPESYRVGIDIGLVSFTPVYIPRYKGSGLPQHWISATHRNRWKGSGFCGSGSGKHVTNSPSGSRACEAIITKALSPSLCSFV